jgi:hypothetical protein
VEVLTIDGVRHRGVPTAVEVEQPEIADGGGGRVVAPEEVVQFVVQPPGEAPGLSSTLNDR